MSSAFDSKLAQQAAETKSALLARDIEAERKTLESAKAKLNQCTQKNEAFLRQLQIVQNRMQTYVDRYSSKDWKDIIQRMTQAGVSRDQIITMLKQTSLSPSEYDSVLPPIPGAVEAMDRDNLASDDEDL